MYDENFMRWAIELSRTALTRPGTEPFAAVVVKDGKIVGEGLNHSAAHFDPTSHGEVEAIRDACRRLKSVDLSGCDLYTSCEPCSLCVATMHISGIRKLYYAVTLQQSRSALANVHPHIRQSGDADKLRIQTGLPLRKREMPAEQHLDNEAINVLDAWAATRQG
jgi:tRNA(Arg) A34 adenosine deaminase TadA